MKNIVTLVLSLVIVCNSNAQNLLERTQLGLSCQSTESPNRIARSMQSLKSTNNFSLFEYNSDLKSNTSKVSLLLDTKALSQLKAQRPKNLSIAVPVSSDQEFTINLFKVNVMEEGSKIITPTDTLLPSKKNLFYRGVITDDHGSIVTLSIIEDEAFISVNDMHGTYRVEPESADKSHYFLKVDNSRNEREVSCGSSGEYQLGSTELYHVEPNDKVQSEEKALSDNVRNYVVCDHRLYLDAGGTVSGTEAYVSLLFLEIGALYANEGINMVVSEIFVYTSSDPYANNGSNTYKSLEEFGTNTPHTFNGDIASLLQGGAYSGGCSLSGLAWVDVLCNKPPNSKYGPYNVTWGLGDCPLSPSAIKYSQAIDVSIVAHELGHNLGSPHTHSCCWGPNGNQAIDNCATTSSCGGGGSLNCGLVSNLPLSDRKTIMSYCGNNTPFSNGFGTLPGNLLRNRVENANCLMSGGPICTDTNKTFDNMTINNGTVVYASNEINIMGSVVVASNSSVMLSAQSNVIVSGEFTVSSSADLVIMSDECN